MTTPSFTIDRRFCGPPQSSNGGYFCGMVAEHFSTPVAIRLKAPPRSMYLLHWSPTATGPASEMTVKILVSPFKPGSLPSQAPF